MKNATRIRIAALATAVFLGALTVAGVAVRPDHGPHAPATAAQAPTSQPSRTADDDGEAQAPDDSAISEIDDE
jgi:hypothetical protein